MLRLGMDAILLQDWVTVRAVAATKTMYQAAESVVDLGAYEDLVFFLDVREVGGPVQVSYQTAPVKEQKAFLNMTAPLALALGVNVTRVFSSNGGVPPARYVRWSLASTTDVGWEVTFRIWLAAYAWRRSMR